MKILVTGSTGFIGNHVLNELIKKEKHEIIATSIESFKNIKNLEWINQVKYISQDLNKNVENYYTLFEKPDLLIHLSWEGLPNYKELFHFERNLFTNYRFIKNMITNGLQDLSVIGTCLEYGLVEGCLSEDLQTNPVTPYGLAKDTLRKFIEELKKIYNFNFKWIRLFYVYGEGQNRNSLLPQLDRALKENQKVFDMSGGEQLRDYLPVEKVAEYVIKISVQNNIDGIINCCSGEPISIKNFIENHLKKRQKNIKLNLGYYPYPDYEPMAFWGDITKLNSIVSKKEDLL